MERRYATHIWSLCVLVFEQMFCQDGAHVSRIFNSSGPLSGSGAGFRLVEHSRRLVVRFESILIFVHPSLKGPGSDWSLGESVEHAVELRHTQGNAASKLPLHDVKIANVDLTIAQDTFPPTLDDA